MEKKMDRAERAEFVRAKLQAFRKLRAMQQFGGEPKIYASIRKLKKKIKRFSKDAINNFVEKIDFKDRRYKGLEYIYYKQGEKDRFTTLFFKERKILFEFSYFENLIYQYNIYYSRIIVSLDQIFKDFINKILIENFFEIFFINKVIEDNYISTIKELEIYMDNVNYRLEIFFILNIIFFYRMFSRIFKISLLQLFFPWRIWENIVGDILNVFKRLELNLEIYIKVFDEYSVIKNPTIAWYKGVYSNDILNLLQRNRRNFFYSSKNFSMKEIVGIIEEKPEGIVNYGTKNIANRFVNDYIYYNLVPIIDDFWQFPELDPIDLKLQSIWLHLDTLEDSLFEQINFNYILSNFSHGFLLRQYEFFLIFLFLLVVICFYFFYYWASNKLRSFFLFIIIIIIYEYFELLQDYISGFLIMYENSRLISANFIYLILKGGLYYVFSEEEEEEDLERTGVERELDFKNLQYNNQELFEILELINFLVIRKCVGLPKKVYSLMSLKMYKKMYTNNYNIDINNESKFIEGISDVDILNKSYKDTGYPIDEYKVYGVRLDLHNFSLYIKKNIYNDVSNSFYDFKDLYIYISKKKKSK